MQECRKLLMYIINYSPEMMSSPLYKKLEVLCSGCEAGSTSTFDGVKIH